MPRLASEWPEIEVDEIYERERDERMRALAVDLGVICARPHAGGRSATRSTTRSAPGARLIHGEIRAPSFMRSIGSQGVSKIAAACSSTAAARPFAAR